MEKWRFFTERKVGKKQVTKILVERERERIITIIVPLVPLSLF
jgi:hypothetical protein